MLFSKNKSGNNYKFDSLKVYAWDRVIAGKKKFRRVFEKSELTYLSAELAIFNKLFDEEDWEAEIKLIARQKKGDASEQVCEKKETITINKTENTYTYSFGWGNDKRGDFWKKGDYEWEAYIDGDLIGSAKFYVEDMGIVSQGQNPYLSVISLNTYEAPDGDIGIDDRVYIKSFNIAITRYIMGELKFLNQVPNEWYCEIFFNIYDDTGMLVGRSDSFTVITPESDIGETFTVTSGWGAAKPGSWIKDNYTMEIIFMDTVIAVIPFAIGEDEIKRISEYEALLNEDVNTIYNDTVKIKESNAESQNSETNKESTDTDKKEDEASDVEVFIDDRPLSEILSDLDGLIGLENIKKKVREYIDYISFLQFREESGIEEKEGVVLHSVFTGNPGTGKTTVVKLLGKIFKSMGLLSKGHVHIVEANDLISGYIRQTGKDTKKAIEKARGGILFVDEAYMLFKEGASNDFGPEAVAAILTEMSDGKGDIAIMVAGYPKEMDTFIESNPGLKSRFRNYFHFEDYTPNELIDIAEFAASKKSVKISSTAAEKLKQILTEAYRKRDKTFGNARFSHALIDEAKINLGIRIMKSANLEELSQKQLSTLTAMDIEDLLNTNEHKQLHLEIDEDLLKEALDELNELVGLNNIKKEVRELIKLTRYYKEINRDILNAFSMHSVFTGNPGTGKTTVARIIGKIYKALGMLERGHLIDADGSDLEAGFLGQTSIKTKELISRAMGGMLFIDEAYSITEGRNTDFGKKAIAALIKEMEDHRSEFGVIVAGYTKNMEQFLKSNPGLKSRFDQRFHFNDFSQDELWEIAVSMFVGKGLVVDKKAEAHLKIYIDFLFNKRDRFFGNARSIRKIVEKSSRNQELRMANLSKAKRTEKQISTLKLEDVADFVPSEEKTGQRQSLGFKIGG